MEHIFTLAFIKKCQSQLKNREIKSLPEQIAFNLLMAIVPLMIVLVQVTAYFSLTTQFVEHILTVYAPKEVQQFIDLSQNSISEPQTTGLIFFATIIPFFWVISKGFHGISTAANTTYQVPLMRFAFLERVMSFLMVCLMIVILIFVIFFTLFGQGIIRLLFNYFNLYLHNYLQIIFNILGSLITFIGYFGFFLILFYLAPSIKLSVYEIIPGSIITAVAWSVSSIAFAFYVNNIADYKRFHGSMSTLIILLFWLYILGYAITIGFQVNYILKRDYLGGVIYSPRLGFIKQKKISEWTSFKNVDIIQVEEEETDL